MKIISYMIGTVFGVGYTPKAPGTAGSLVAVLLFYFYPFSIFNLFTLIFIITILGTWAAFYIEKISGKEDPGLIVVDEFVGQSITLIAIPHNWVWFLIAFILFRTFDIYKPFGINQIQKLPYGLGVMADDILAGVYSLLIIQGLSFFHFL